MIKSLLYDYEEEQPGVLSHVRELVGDIGEAQAITPDIACRTGVVGLDGAFHGVPAGITLIFGEPGVGKTALLGALLSAAQKSGKSVALAQTEYFDGPYFSAMGVDLGRLPLIPFEDREVFSEACIDFISQDNAVLAVDSISGFRPWEEDRGAWNELVYEFAQIIQDTRGRGSAVVLTSHVRAKRSLMQGKTFAGGTMSATRNLGRLVDLELELSREDVSDARYTMLVKVLSSAISKPGVWAEVPVIKGKGIDIRQDLLDTALAAGVITQRGAWYYLKGVRLGSGKEAAADRLFNDKELISRAVRSLYR